MKSSARGPASLIDRTTGTIIGNADSRQSAAFDGDTTQSNTQAALKNNAAAQSMYIGKTFAVPTALESVKVYGSNNQGFLWIGSGSMTLTLYGKSGSAPANGTNGTVLGSITFNDTANESAGRTITSSDTATYWDHAWVNLTQGANVNLLIAEIEMTGWI